MPRRPWIAASLALAALCALGAAAAWRSLHSPVALPPPQASSLVLAADGSVLAALHAEQDRVPVPLTRVPKTLRDAVLAAEDARFARHRGVDPWSIMRALVRNLRAGQVREGGSTITQQLAKLTVTGGERSLRRKLREAWTALRIETTLSKDEILERYLNTVYLGGGSYGVQAAAQRTFGVDVDELDLSQSALLAGLVQAPTSGDPFRHPERAERRRRAVLDRMAALGWIDEAQAARAKARPPTLASRPPDWRAPWFVDHALDLLQHHDAFAALGADADRRAERLFRGGLRIETTLDPSWQHAAERAVAEVLHDPDDPRAALVAIDPATGAIRALVGGRGYGDPADPVGRFNLAVDAVRQPGSAFKPLVLAAALTRGHTLDERFPGGAEARLAVPGSAEPWVVRNYDRRDHGTIDLRTATRWSVNTAYARLALDIGPEAVVELAGAAGIGTPLEPYPAIALGVEEVRVLDLAAVQATFAAGGLAREPVAVRRVLDRDGRVLIETAPRTRRAMPEPVAALVTDVLRDVVERGTAQAAVIGRPLAGKTGTSQHGADAWFAGYTPLLAAAVWVGFPEAAVPMLPPRTRLRVEGGGWPAEIFARFARAALAGEPEDDFPSPEQGLVAVRVDRTRNCLPNAYTPHELVELRRYLPGTEPVERCSEPTGPDGAVVPDVVGLPERTATRMLTDAGLRLRRRLVADPSVPTGHVVRQDPPGGTALSPDPRRHPEVTLWLSSPAEVLVPDVLGMGREAAERALEQAGLRARARTACPDGTNTCTGARTRPGTVWEQRPDAGRRRPLDAVVELSVYPGT